MHSHEAITISRALRAAIAAVIVALAVTACGVTGPDAASCKAALQAEYIKARQGHFGAVPSACKGLQKDEVQRFMQQIEEGK
jgi:hypothetical protein